MYYNRLTQVRRVGQRISPPHLEETHGRTEPDSDVFEFGYEASSNDAPVELELCKGVLYPMD